MLCVLVKPPYFRYAGSHNNKEFSEIRYLRSVLSENSIDTLEVNGDSSNSKGHFTWRTLVNNSEMFKDNVVKGVNNSILHELVEEVLAYKPDVIGIMSGDTFMSSVGMDNPHIAKSLAKLLRSKSKIPLFGIGTYFQVFPQLQTEVSLTIKNGPNHKTSEVVRNLVTKKLCDTVIDVGPIDWTIRGSSFYQYKENPGHKVDLSYIQSSRGCSFPCKFCYNTVASNKFEECPINKIIEDITYKVGLGYKRLYYTDQILTRNPKKLNELADAYEASSAFNFNCTFVGEARCELVLKFGEKVLKPLSRLKLTNLKIGVENVGEDFGSSVKKTQGRNDIRKAVDLIRNHGIKVSAYLFLGAISEKEYEETLEFCKKVDFDGYIISAWSVPIDTSNQSFDECVGDAHFSITRKKEWNLPDWVVDEYLKLQESKGGNHLLSYVGG
jgi:hypothetical protein